ncbi:MAG TPA: hypothetical protein VN737_04570 [Bryobacteraceae bacterium]|nr:hypothetical protein [Bryobacteraceae bacterium]
MSSEWAVLLQRPAALHGCGFHPAWGRPRIPAEMPVVPRRLVDRRDRHRLLGNRRGLGVRNPSTVLGSGRGAVGGGRVAHALLRAASRLISTLAVNLSSPAIF